MIPSCQNQKESDMLTSSDKSIPDEESVPLEA